MTVEQLIKQLSEMPKDATLEFLGYACGNHFYERVNETDFMLSDDKTKVTIKADWN